MTPSRLHATFMYHCAFAHKPGEQHVDVLLPPGEHEREHIPALRIPEPCVLDDSEHPGEEQETETLDRRVTADLTWDLSGYDLLVDFPEEGQAPRAASRVVPTVTDETATPWTIADFRDLAGVGIDRRFVEGPVPEELQRNGGARVRVWGGEMRCGKPRRGLLHRRFAYGPFKSVGLSDRMDFEDILSRGDTITLGFRRFGEMAVKRVILRPQSDRGIIRMHVSNDPVVHELHGQATTDPCSELEHFKSYAILLPPNDDGKRTLPVPTALFQWEADFGTILEGESLCCPCAHGTGP